MNKDHELHEVIERLSRIEHAIERLTKAERQVGHIVAEAVEAYPNPPEWKAPDYYNAWVSHQYRYRGGEPQRVLVVNGPGARELRDCILTIIGQCYSHLGDWEFVRVQLAEMFEENSQPYPLP